MGIKINIKIEKCTPKKKKKKAKNIEKKNNGVLEYKE